MLILILFLLLAFGPAGYAQDTYPPVARIVAVGDVHGDLDAFLAILRMAGVVDKKNKWTGGKTHLVQTGDLLDRGPTSRKVMDLLIALEKQAAKAGGRVHVLNGNHEAMNMYGDLRYTIAGEFDAFRTDDSPRIRDAFWQEQLKLTPDKSDDASRKAWDAEHPLGWFEHRFAFTPQGTYGKWLRTHNALLKIGDTLFLHGGVSPKYAATPISALNQAIGELLADVTKIKDGDIVTGDDSPLWYRGLAQAPESSLAEHVDQVLASFGVKRIVIGHTPTDGTIVPRFGGKVMLIDVGMSAYYSQKGRACLVIEKGQASPLPK